MKNTRLFWQIFLPALLIIASSIFATTWIGTRMIQSFYYEQMQGDIKDRALLLKPHILQLLAAGDADLQEFCRQNGRVADTRITVIAGDGRVLADSSESPARMDNHGRRPEIIAALQGDTGSSLRRSKTLAKNMLYVAVPLESDRPQAGVLRLSVAATALESVLSTIYTKIILGACLIGLLAACFSYWMARRISRPLEEMRRGAEMLAAGTTHQPIAMEHVHLSRETTELARSLNNMAEQINARMKTISRQANELEAVFGSMTDGVLAVAADHHIIRINRAAAELFAIDSKAVQGKSMQAVLRSLILQEFVNRVLASQETAVEDVVLSLQGREITLRIRSVPLLDGEGQKMGILLVMNNLTRVNQLETVRRNFVANVSHELKTPITSIRGYVETLLDGAMEDPEDVKKFLAVIDRQGARLDAIVDDLLSLARIEDRAENDDVILQQETLLPILEASAQACSLQAKQHNIILDLDCDARLTAPVNQVMLEQAVINLLTNAIKYSPAGKVVTLKAEINPGKGEQQAIRISVRDQGPGIAPEHLERIFERFYRCDKARSRENGGTGLGLSIVKHIAQCHGGTVDVVSIAGEGATFTLTLPMSPA